MKLIFKTVASAGIIAAWCAASLAAQELSDTELAFRDSVWYSRHPGQLPIWETLAERKHRAAGLLHSAAPDRFTATQHPPAGRVRTIAEYEPEQGVLIAYANGFGLSTAVIKELANETTVYCIASSGNQTRARSVLQNGGVDMGGVVFITANVDSYWTRDFGPWWIADSAGGVSVLDFPYNRPRQQDDAVPNAIASLWNLTSYYLPIKHAGGNFMCDGKAIAASTDLVLSENASFTRQQIDSLTNRYLGIETYHFTPDPLSDYIKHIDCWGKFLGPDKVLIGQVTGDRNRQYDSVANFFAKQTSAWGTRYKVYRIFTNGEPYTNSLILNKKVFVPIQRTSNDSAALAVYRKAMPGYTVMGFTGSWESTDALHCRAIGIADRGMLYIAHQPLHDTVVVATIPQVPVTAHIVPYSKAKLITDSLSVFFSYRRSGPYSPLALAMRPDNGYEAALPIPQADTTVYYYIRAADSSGKRAFHPYAGADDPHFFYARRYAVGITARRALPLSEKMDLDLKAARTGVTITYRLGTIYPGARLSVYLADGRRAATIPLSVRCGSLPWNKGIKTGSLLVFRLENRGMAITKKAVCID